VSDDKLSRWSQLGLSNIITGEGGGCDVTLYDSVLKVGKIVLIVHVVLYYIMTDGLYQVLTIM